MYYDGSELSSQGEKCEQKKAVPICAEEKESQIRGGNSMLVVNESYAAEKAEYGDSFVSFITTQLLSFWDTTAFLYFSSFMLAN